ncbi:MAG TPA: oligopeptide/dipeptide ABC transporter ATP-binding protein [Arenicellales bacterium]|nr:oligopeptide/dipeptide ABC transporter ATP-binding protein [Arenicellales bacterium]
MSALLQVRNLSKTYPTRRGLVRAVNDVSFDVPAGRTVALVGESGCGKTTVALTLLRLIEHDGGEVYFDGENFDQLSRSRRQAVRRELSIVFQNPYSSLDPRMRIRDIVGEPLRTVYRLRGRELTDQAARHLENVGLAREHLSRYPHEFSGGQRQRIAIARALALEPRLLVLDEPTSALDVSVQAQVLNLLRDLQQRMGLSYLFISHNLAVVEQMADDVMVMYLGHIVESGPVAEVFESPLHPYTRALLDAIPSVDPSRRDRLKPISGEIPSALARPAGCPFAPRCARADRQCRSAMPPLAGDSESRRAACFHPLSQETEQ